MASPTIAKRLVSSAASKKDLNLKGIFVAITTPFDDDQRISFDRLKQNLTKYEKIPFTGYLVSGSNGEAPFLTPDERIQLVKFVRENTQKDKVIIGNSTAETTSMACHLTTEISKAGGDCCLIMPPFYFKKTMTDEAIIKHYTTIADKSGVPIVIYNNPGVCGIDIATPLLVQLANHPLIRGVKDGDIRKNAVTVQETKSLNFDVHVSSAGYLLGGLINGCSGGIVGLAAALGQDICDIYTAYNNNQWDKAVPLQVRLAKMDVLLSMANLGVPGLKATMDMLGLSGGHCRGPILSITEEEKQKIKATLQNGGYL